jgi:hypothetical protein
MGKNDQHSKIYLPCNCEVNLITHLGVIEKFTDGRRTPSDGNNSHS